MYLSMLEYALSTPSYYFSTSFDLTHTLQRLASTDDEGFKSEPLSNRADHRYVVSSNFVFMAVSHLLADILVD